MAKKSQRSKGLIAALEKVPAPQIAAALGISCPAIYQWFDVPIRRVHDVSRVTGLPLHVLRPDFFGQPRQRRRGEHAAA